MGRPTLAYQVERARFDRVLAQCAREAGARFLERATVKELIVARSQSPRHCGMRTVPDIVRRMGQVADGEFS